MEQSKTVQKTPGDYIVGSNAGYILRDMTDGLVVVDWEGRLKGINPAAEKLLEVKSDGNELFFVQLFQGDSRNDGFIQAILDALDSQSKSEHSLCDYYTPDGERKIISIKSTYAKDDDERKELIIVLSDVTEREMSLKHNKDVVFLTSVFFAFICVFIFVFKFFDKVLPGVVPPSTITMASLFIMLFLSYLFVKKTSVRLHLAWKGKSVLDGVLITALIIAVMCLVKLLLVRFGVLSVTDSAPFFNFGKFTWKELYWYLPCVLMQEFIARSVVQETLLYIFGEKNAWLSILILSLLFGTMHVTYSFTMMIGAALMMGVLGMFYHKSRNLLAVSIVHYCCAEAAIILGFI